MQLGGWGYWYCVVCISCHVALVYSVYFILSTALVDTLYCVALGDGGLIDRDIVRGSPDSHLACHCNCLIIIIIIITIIIIVIIVIIVSVIIVSVIIVPIVIVIITIIIIIVISIIVIVNRSMALVI